MPRPSAQPLPSSRAVLRTPPFYMATALQNIPSSTDDLILLFITTTRTFPSVPWGLAQQVEKLSVFYTVVCTLGQIFMEAVRTRQIQKPETQPCQSGKAVDDCRAGVVQLIQQAFIKNLPWQAQRWAKQDSCLWDHDPRRGYQWKQQLPTGKTTDLHRDS